MKTFQSVLLKSSITNLPEKMKDNRLFIICRLIGELFLQHYFSCEAILNIISRLQRQRTDASVQALCVLLTIVGGCLDRCGIHTEAMNNIFNSMKSFRQRMKPTESTLKMIRTLCKFRKNNWTLLQLPPAPSPGYLEAAGEQMLPSVQFITPGSLDWNTVGQDNEEEVPRVPHDFSPEDQDCTWGDPNFDMYGFFIEHQHAWDAWRGCTWVPVGPQLGPPHSPHALSAAASNASDEPDIIEYHPSGEEYGADQVADRLESQLQELLSEAQQVEERTSREEAEEAQAVEEEEEEEESEPESDYEDARAYQSYSPNSSAENITKSLVANCSESGKAPETSAGMEAARAAHSTDIVKEAVASEEEDTDTEEMEASAVRTPEVGEKTLTFESKGPELNPVDTAVEYVEFVVPVDVAMEPVAEAVEAVLHPEISECLEAWSDCPGAIGPLVIKTPCKTSTAPAEASAGTIISALVEPASTDFSSRNEGGVEFTTPVKQMTADDAVEDTKMTKANEMVNNTMLNEKPATQVMTAVEETSTKRMTTTTKITGTNETVTREKLTKKKKSSSALNLAAKIAALELTATAPVREFPTAGLLTQSTPTPTTVASPEPANVREEKEEKKTWWVQAACSRLILNSINTWQSMSRRERMISVLTCLTFVSDIYLSTINATHTSSINILPVIKWMKSQYVILKNNGSEC
ncbi:uncharacterized protein LOC106163549 [Lingula anatina]|uniref:Uncharacterized protein LOC106163549 n=1 Tax=Lingula anatina TaxID=7574 RepID=A0A1S3IEQ2_LINAN|nr:uncharacterized protein LOC106163549 [Lingula anatina]|eukprot:XP_013396623.1 uncharacterized protein LOC106163549 [Lingula anatina]